MRSVQKQLANSCKKTNTPRQQGTGKKEEKTKDKTTHHIHETKGDLFTTGPDVKEKWEMQQTKNILNF